MELDEWRYFALVDPPEPPYGVIRQRGPEIERWSPRRECWYVALFHADLLWRGEPGKKPISAEEAESLRGAPSMVDLHPDDIQRLNRWPRPSAGSATELVAEGRAELD